MNWFGLALAGAFVAAHPGALAAGTVVAWGAGHGPLPSGLTDVIAISSGIDHSLALKGNGTVIAWGHNFDGQCNVPGGLNQVVQIAAGDFFSVALKADGTIAGWGSDDYNQLQVPAGPAGIKAISAGHAHVVALRSNGTVVAWGSNVYGQTNVPPGLDGVARVLAAWNYSMAVRSNGTVVAWGANDSGDITVPEGLTGVVQVAGNSEYALALRSNGTVVAWGRASALPGELNGITRAALGDQHGVAVGDSGLRAWGDNQSGESTIPSGLGTVLSLSAGWNYTLALTEPGTTLPVFSLVNPIFSGSTFRVSLSSEPGRSYRLEYRDSAANGAWTQLPVVMGTGGELTLTNNNAATGMRIYRVSAE
jgi:alpha-tubulin suppressor-like RCC1 family protein